MNEELETKMEPDNVRWINMLFMLKEHFCSRTFGENGKFAKMIFYFLVADPDAECKAVITGKEVNLDDGVAMQVPCKLKILGPRKMVEILCKNIQCFKFFNPSMIQSVGHFWLLFPTNQWKTALSIWL